MPSWLNYDTIKIVGYVLGGLTIFIYGVEMMSDALKSIAGTHIREYIEKYTKNLFMSILVGTILSALLHSSAAVTVISISLVRAGLMGLKQAIGITIGANIGTCATSIMIGFNVEEYAYFFVAIGIILMLASKKKKITYLGKALAGFGLIFVGLDTVSTQLTEIAQQQWFLDAMVTIGQYPWLALLGSTVVTAIMQSSTAVVGIVQKLYVTGALTNEASAAFIFGANVGTCMTALIASIGGSVSTKRAAWFHAVYNAAGALIGMLLLNQFISLTDWFNVFVQGSGEMYVALQHFLFNLISTILVIPLVDWCIKLLTKLIPGEEGHDIHIENIDELDDQLIEQLPAGALEVAKKNTARMGRNIIENMHVSKEYLETRKQETYDEVVEIESLINKYDTNLSAYLLKIAQQPTLSHDQTQEYYKTYQIIKYMEQICDQVVLISDLYHNYYEDNGHFSKEVIEDIKRLYKGAGEMLTQAIHVYEEERTSDQIRYMYKLERNYNRLTLECQQNHFERVANKSSEDIKASATIEEIFSAMDRIGDLSLDIVNRTFIPYSKHEQKYLDPATIDTNV